MTTPQQSAEDRRNNAIAGLIVGALITGPAFLLAVLTMGSYGFARLFFPYSMLLTLITGNRITLGLIALAFVQFPIYGFVIGASSGEHKNHTVVGALIFLGHAAAATLCFSGLIPNFS